MDKLEMWRNSQKYKSQPLPYHQQRTLDFLRKTLFDKPRCEKVNDKLCVK